MDPSPLPPSPSERQLRDSLALLELDFTEFREHTQAKLSDTHNTNIYIQELKDELQQLKKTPAPPSLNSQELSENCKKKQTLRLQFCKLEKDTEKKEVNFSRQLQDMREQLQKIQKTIHFTTIQLQTNQTTLTQNACLRQTHRHLQQHRPHLPSLQNLIQMFSS